MFSSRLATRCSPSKRFRIQTRKTRTLSNRLAFKTLAATAAVVMSAAVACAQETTQEPALSAQQKPTAKPHKVWTEDDIAALRPSVDDEPGQKKAQVSAEVSATAGTPTSFAPQPSSQVKQASALVEAERAIEDLLEDINDQRDTLARLNKELGEVPEDQRVERTREIERRSSVLQECEKDLKALQDKRDEFARKTALANSVGT